MTVNVAQSMLPYMYMKLQNVSGYLDVRVRSMSNVNRLNYSLHSAWMGLKFTTLWWVIIQIEATPQLVAALE